jgi:hypothetical protein
MDKKNIFIIVGIIVLVVGLVIVFGNLKENYVPAESSKGESVNNTQNVKNVSFEKAVAEKDWCVVGSLMNYKKIKNSQEWVLAGTRYYNGTLYCSAQKLNSSINYLFNEDYLVVYSSETGDARRVKFTLIS